MLKKLTLAFAVAFMPFLLMAQSEQKIGVMNPDRVVEALPEMERIQSELEQYVEERQQEFAREYSTYIEVATNYEQGISSGTLSGEDRAREEERLTEMEEQLAGLEQRIQLQIQSRQNELITPVMEKVEQAMQKVARQMDLDLVLNRQTSQGDLLIFYVSGNGVDITDRVIEELTSN